jgi:pyrroloquinoline quinone biosynthesis protein D
VEENCLQRKVRIHANAGVQRVGDRLLAVGPGDLLHVFEDESGQPSPVAERIIELADGTRTLESIAQTLCAEFEVDPQVCVSDILAFAKLLVERELLIFA